jgi:hypothetical protein
MAADLMLRLCQIDETEGGLPGAGQPPGDPNYDPQTSHISIGLFMSALRQLRNGTIDRTQIQNGFNMSTQQMAEFNAFADLVLTGAGGDKRIIGDRIDEFECALFNYQQSRKFDFLSAFDTPDEVQNWVQSKLPTIM